MHFTATILISTRDRKDELSRALESAITQVEVSEILVFDDGSSDGTGELVRTQFSSVRYERSDQPLGIVGARNRAMQLARGSVVITIDDDCVFQSPYTARDSLNDFAEDPRIGAVAIPHIDVNAPSAAEPSAPRVDSVHVLAEFCGGASAIRRDLFLGLGGYNPLLWRQGEESDFCTRLLEHGYVTRRGTATPILHYASPDHRNLDLITYHFARSRMIYAWCNVPWPVLGIHCVATAAMALQYAYKNGCLGSGAMGLSNALSTILLSRPNRSPVSTSTYWLTRRLRSRGATKLSSLQLRPRLET